MNPISRLRVRARSRIVRFATGLPLSQYSPPVGVSSSPKIDSSVDLPHPDGPAIDTYSPRRNLQMNAAQRVRLDLIGIEDLLDAV